MKHIRPKELTQHLDNHETIWPFALLSLSAGGCAIGLLIVILRHAEKIVSLGLTGRLFFIVQVVLALCVSTSLFGINRSRAIYRGKMFGGSMELRGPAALFLLVLLLGRTLPEPAENFSLTILVHGPKGNADMVLRSSGSMILDTGELRRTVQIGANGEAVFLEIPANMRGREASLGLDAEGFELANAESKLTLSPTTFYVEVHPKPGRIAGHIKTYDGQPLPGVTISAGKIRTTTDDQGYFEMQVPRQDANHDITLVVTKPGYEAWTGLEVTNSNDLTITLQKKR